MLDWIFIMLLVIAVLLILMSIEFQENGFWCLISIVLSATIFYILALSIMEIEIPWQMYNATSGNIETGYHTFSSPVSPFLVYIFAGLGTIMMIYLVAMTYDKYMEFREG